MEPWAQVHGVRIKTWKARLWWSGGRLLVGGARFLGQRVSSENMFDHYESSFFSMSFCHGLLAWLITCLITMVDHYDGF